MSAVAATQTGLMPVTYKKPRLMLVRTQRAPVETTNELITINRTRLDAILASQRETARFIERNKSFIHRVIQDVHSRCCKSIEMSLHYSDLYSIGTIAMWRGMTKYEDGKNTTLSTYLYRVIERDVRRYYTNEMKQSKNVVSMETFMGTSECGVKDEYYEGAFVATMSGRPIDKNPENVILEQMHADQILSSFSPMERQIIKMVYIHKMTHAKTAEAVGITRGQMQYMFYKDIRPKIKRIKMLAKKYAS